VSRPTSGSIDDTVTGEEPLFEDESMSVDTGPQTNAGLVMIIDDDPQICDLISMALSEQGYRTVTAGDGMQALPVIERDPPSLILMDVGMPALGGRDLAARVNELWGDAIPCVIMSGSRPSAEDRADKTVVAYLPKPFDLEELFGVVRHHARTVEITHR